MSTFRALDLWVLFPAPVGSLGTFFLPVPVPTGGDTPSSPNRRVPPSSPNGGGGGGKGVPHPVPTGGYLQPIQMGVTPSSPNGVEVPLSSPDGEGGYPILSKQGLPPSSPYWGEGTLIQSQQRGTLIQSRWGGGYPHPVLMGWRYPHPVLMGGGGCPHTVLTWGGYPHPVPMGGYPHLVLMGGYPRVPPLVLTWDGVPPVLEPQMGDPPSLT